jgi:excisionase family DNA binding protein
MLDKQRYMLIGEVSQEARASPSTVRHWLRTGKLRSVRPGRRRLVERVEFERFLRAGGDNQGRHR